MYANPYAGEGQKQLDLYKQARQAFAGVEFPAMGNHECTGYTASNCGLGGQDGITNNFTAFTQTLLQPIGQTNPYYRFDVNASNGQWTAKFLVLAMNAWDTAQQSWLQQQLQDSTTYTFIVRHEPSNANTAPGVTPSDALIDAAPYTLKIVGHSHEFYQSGAREVIVGNGGAPLSHGSWGYALIFLTPSGDVQVDQMDYNSNAVLEWFTVSK
jgi:hypothetical protein